MPRIDTNTCEQEINMASEMEIVNEELIEESTATKGRKKAARDGKDRGRARSWTEPKIDQLIDLLEEKDCLWDVNKKENHVRNKRERTFEKMKSRQRLLVCVLRVLGILILRPNM